MLTTGRYLHDFDKWTSIDKKKPPEGVIVEITDADSDGWYDFVFHGCLSHDGYFYDKEGTMLCAAYTISYWKPI